MLLAMIGACKKDTKLFRSTQYNLVAQNSSGLTGTVSFVEVIDSPKIQVDVEIQHALMGSYDVHLHDGTPTSYHVIRYDMGVIYPTGGKLSNKIYVPISYDSAIVYNGTFVIHDSTGNNVLGVCGVGKNKNL